MLLTLVINVSPLTTGETFVLIFPVLSQIFMSFKVPTFSGQLRIKITHFLL